MKIFLPVKNSLSVEVLRVCGRYETSHELFSLDSNDIVILVYACSHDVHYPQENMHAYATVYANTYT